MAEEELGLKGWLSGARPKRSGEASGKRGPQDKHRLVVLPMASMSPDPNDAYFAEGVTDEIISTLSTVRGLSVISRTSAMGYRGTTKRVGEIGRELNVRWVLEGSLKKAGDKVRIVTQLIDVDSDVHVWAQSYDRELDDVFAVQVEISRRVAEALQVELAAQEGQGPRGGQAGGSGAYVMYLKGRHFWNKGNLEGLEKAREHFEEAIQKEPNFALAYAGLADAHLLLGRNGHAPPKLAYPKAIEYAQRALSIDPGLSEPHLALAAIRQEFEWNWAEAAKEFESAIALSPSYANAHSWYALYLGHMGRSGDAIKEAERAQELNPLWPGVYGTTSEEYMLARQYDAAIEAANRALKLNPEFALGYAYRGMSQAGRGEFAEAIADFQMTGKLRGARAWRGRLGHAYAISGGRTEAMKILDELVAGPAPEAAFPISLVYLGLGDKESSIDWLERAAEGHLAGCSLTHLKCDPIFESVREEPRFRALMTRMGLAS